MSTSSKSTLWRLMAILAVFALIVAACADGDTSDDTEAPAETEAPAATEAPADDEPADDEPMDDEPADDEPAPAAFTYAMGMTSDITTTNYWAYYNADGTVYNSYVLGGQAASVFGIDLPSLAVVPSLGVGLPAEAVQDGDNWVITQEIRTDATWSDGTPITAGDIAFTFNTAKDVGLGGSWLSAYIYDVEAFDTALLSVEAPDDATVVYTFTGQPGLGLWPHSVGIAPVMPQHVWQDAVDAALGTEDPVATLQSEDGQGTTGAGGHTLDTWEEGAFVVRSASDNYFGRGDEVVITDNGSYSLNGEWLYGDGGGNVVTEYTDGPYADQVTYSIYSDQSAAMLALVNGEIDYWINPLGVSPGLRDQGLTADNLSIAVNPTNGMRYMAFNLRKSPGSYKGYRQAVAYMVDKEFLTQNVLQGVAFPMYVMVPEGNQKWFNTEFADEQKAKYQGLSEAERLAAAIEVLEADGFSWATPAVIEEGSIVSYPEGLIDPTGTPVAEQEVLAPPASYDPLRATAALWIEGWLENLGVTAVANPTDFNTIVAAIWPGVGEEITFDIYLLGWSLGNAAFPTFHEAFWHSRYLAEVNDGNNSTGFQNAEFDAAADSIIAAQTEEEAYANMWVAEAILADELPYVVLFDTPITEFFNNSLNFPFTSTISGLQFGSGFTALATK
ncbi:MAG: ABC transporter substrate-binding protein [Acidimicrobiia bacterium]|nr:ABC transporter substrate-binding protein [Acidimicrobiia bacterium]